MILETMQRKPISGDELKTDVSLLKINKGVKTKVLPMADDFTKRTLFLIILHFYTALKVLDIKISHNKPLARPMWGWIFWGRTIVLVLLGYDFPTIPSPPISTVYLHAVSSA